MVIVIFEKDKKIFISLTVKANWICWTSNMEDKD